MIIAGWLLFGAVLATMHFVWRKRRLFYLNIKLGGPFPYPFIGSAHLVMDPNKSVERCFEFIRKYGNMFAVWAGFEMYVCVASAQGMADVLRHPDVAVKGISYTFLERLVGGGLFTRSGEQWSFYRKHINPTFKSTNIALLMPVIDKHVQIFMRCLQKKAAATSDEFDVRSITARFVIDSIMDSLMDQNTDIQLGKNPEFTSALNIILHIIGNRMFNPLLQYMPLYRWTSKYTIETHQIENVVNPFIQKNLDAHMRKNSNKSSAEPDDAPRYIKDLIRLFEVERKFTYDDMHNNIKTMIIAGYDTTCSTLSFLILMLAMHPEMQQRVYDEIIATGLPDDHAWTMEELAQLTFLDRCVKETLRLFPAGAYVERTNKDYLTVDGHLVPPGAQIILGIVHVHRSAEHWSHPNDFRPDHFLPEECEGRHPYAYVPFSAGQRVCIGTRFAYATLRAAIVALVRNFELRTTMRLDELRLRFDVTLNVQQGFNVALRSRAAVVRVE